MLPMPMGTRRGMPGPRSSFPLQESRVADRLAGKKFLENGKFHFSEITDMLFVISKPFCALIQSLSPFQSVKECTLLICQ
jgi:hypothetical protein